jgi:hypothetical protein
VSRDVDSIKSAFAKTSGRQADSQLRGFPPGHFVGFFLSIDGGQIVVSPGEANVAGVEVILKNRATVEENAWAVTRSAQHMYYIYLKRDGMFWVDTLDPTWQSLYNGNYHPVLGYRYLGKVFNDSDGKIIYKLSAHYDQQSSIIVGAKGFTGYMDYECDGVADQEEINLALKFATEWSEYGGKVHLSRGGFFTTAAVEGDSNCTLEGEGPGATVVKKNGNFYAIECIGTSVIPKVNFQIRDMTITRDATDTNDIDLVRIEYVHNLLIEYCECLDAYSDSLHIIVSNGQVLHNKIWWADAPGAANVTGIYLYVCDSLRVEGNEIGPITNYAAGNFVGIENAGNNHEYITSNLIHDLSAIGISIGIRCIGAALVANNIITECCDYTSSGVNGIYVTGGSALNPSVVTENYGRDNGNLIDYGNCESATPPAMFGEVSVTLSNCTFARSNAEAHSGTYSYKVTKTNAAGTYAAVYLSDNILTNDLHGIVVGKTHTVSMRVRIPPGGMTGTELKVGGINYVSAAWAEIGSDTAANTYDEWQELVTQGTVNAGATGFTVQLFMAATMAINEYFYIDDIRLRPDGVGNDYGQNYVDAGTGTLTGSNSWQL